MWPINDWLDEFFTTDHSMGRARCCLEAITPPINHDDRNKEQNWQHFGDDDGRKDA